MGRNTPHSTPDDTTQPFRCDDLAALGLNPHGPSDPNRSDVGPFWPFWTLSRQGMLTLEGLIQDIIQRRGKLGSKERLFLFLRRETFVCAKNGRQLGAKHPKYPKTNPFVAHPLCKQQEDVAGGFTSPNANVNTDEGCRGRDRPNTGQVT